MQTILQAFMASIQQVLTTFLHNWPYLIASILLASAFKLYLKPEKVSAFLLRYRKLGVVAATAAAVGTPLCSCGTTAIVLGMMAGMMPWAPIIAFMVASPLSSPEGMIYSAGLFGWPFAITYFVSSILLGLAAGGIASMLENHGWFRNQSRFTNQGTAAPARASAGENGSSCGCGGAPRPVVPPEPTAACGCGGGQAVVAAATVSCGCGAQTIALQPAPAQACGCAGPVAAGNAMRVEKTSRLQLPGLWQECVQTAARILPMFFGFAFIGFFLNNLIPQAWVESIFGAGNLYSVPLAATLGLPLYINSEASLPLVLGLIEGGMSKGAAMAFLLCGSGTSLGAMAGAMTIARWRVVALVAGILWLGAIVTGFAYDALLMAGLF